MSQTAAANSPRHAVLPAARQAVPSARRRFIARYPGLGALTTYSAAVYIGQALVIIRGGLLAPLLAPAAFGLWRLLKLGLDYAQYLPFGTLHALRQEVPTALGRRDPARARQIVRVIFGTLLLICAITLTAAWAGCWVAVRWRPDVASRGLLVVPFLITASLLLQFADAKFVSEERPATSGGMALVFALLSLIAMPWGAHVAGLAGALAGLLLSQLTVLAWLAIRGTFPVPVWPRWRTLQPLWRIGWPIWVTWIPLTVLGDVDQWLVGAWLGPAKMGYYGIVIFLGSLLMFLPFIFRSTYQPFLTRASAGSSDPADLRRSIERSLYLIGYAAPLPIAALYFASTPLVEAWLPAYREVLPAARWYCLGTFWWMVASVTGMMCVVAGRKRRWFAQTLLAIAGHVALTTAVIRAGGGLTGVALCTATVFTLYAAAQVHAVLRIVEAGWRNWAAVLGRLLVPFGTLTGLCLGLSRVWPLSASEWTATLGPALAGTAVACSTLALLFAAANRRLAFTELLRHRIGSVQLPPAAADASTAVPEGTDAFD